MTKAACQRESLDEMSRGDDLSRRLARIYMHVLARAAQEEVAPTSERPQIAASAHDSTPATEPGDIQELINGGDESE